MRSGGGGLIEHVFAIPNRLRRRRHKLSSFQTQRAPLQGPAAAPIRQRGFLNLKFKLLLLLYFDNRSLFQCLPSVNLDHELFVKHIFTNSEFLNKSINFETST